MKIHAINAAEGDCLLLESEGQAVLVDGGVAGIYEKHLAPHLTQRLGEGGTLVAVVVSHVDADHIAGILDLCADIERAQADAEPAPFNVREIWLNGFGSTLDSTEGALFGNLQAMISQAGRRETATPHGAVALLGIAQGARLQRIASKLEIPMNKLFGGKLISEETTRASPLTVGSMEFSIVGPTEPQLAALRNEWLTWIEDNLDAFMTGDKQAMANADSRVPNLSSIVMYGKTPSGSVLLTGDARGDHILQGLEQRGIIAPGESLHLRLLKMQHHGSIRNIAEDFARRITADIYLFSANGKHGNPDLETLEMILDAAAEQGRSPLLAFTNKSDSVRDLLAQRPPSTHGYTVAVRNPEDHAIVINLESGEISGD